MPSLKSGKRRSWQSGGRPLVHQVGFRVVYLEADVHLEAGAGRAVAGPDLAVLGFDKAAADSEAKAHAPDRLRERFHAVEAVENALHLVVGDAGAVVTDHELDTVRSL